MSDRLSDDQVDARVRAFLVQRAEEVVAAAPPAELVTLRVADRARMSPGWLTWWRSLPSAARLISLALLLLALGAVAFAAARPTPRPLTNGPITFIDGSDVIVVGADGSGLHTLTTVQRPDSGAICCWVSYAPDGKRLLTGTTSSLDIMNADGSDRTELLRGPNLGYPTWSPDGSRVALAMAVDGLQQIVIIDIAGGAPRQVTRGLVFAAEPTWSHDGERIALAGASTATSGQAIFVVGADGTGLHQVGPDLPPGVTVADSGPMWSPDDRAIAFDVGSPTQPRSTIDIVGVDGSGFRSLLPAGLEGTVPIWSPDGTWIAFSGWHAGDRTADLYVIRPDGSGDRRLATDVSLYEHPWSPDGTLIAYAHQASLPISASGPIGASGTSYADLREIRPDGSAERIVATRRINATVAWPRG
jgi:Tol biopolymer transport system component